MNRLSYIFRSYNHGSHQNEENKQEEEKRQDQPRQEDQEELQVADESNVELSLNRTKDIDNSKDKGSVPVQDRPNFSNLRNQPEWVIPTKSPNREQLRA